MKAAALVQALRFLLPTRCLGCASPLALDQAETLICPACGAALREPPWPRCARCDFPRGTGRAPGTACLECARWPGALTRARAATVLEPPADALVHALKYGGWRRLAVPLGTRMARLCRIPGALVVPIPTTPARLRRRGYNQAALLAAAYAAALGSRLVDPLERVREGPSQVTLAPERRLSNVSGAFRALPSARALLAGREVVLVDDVLTTGATAIAAALVLERAGATGVSVVTFARALPGRAALA